MTSEQVFQHMNVNDFMNEAGANIRIVNAIAKTHNMLQRFMRPVCAISGGSDSDILLDILSRLDEDKDVKYVWYNTGIEYQATKKHLDFLEGKYGIKIERIKAVKPIAQCCREYGQPFVNKIASQFIEALQVKGFNFSDMPYEEMKEQYGKSYADWWHNRGRIYSINKNRGLKEFMLANPPKFKISSKCCTYAKKKSALNYVRSINADLEIIGLRRAEGGARKNIKTCFVGNAEQGRFYPIFWLTNEDKENYCKIFGVVHSDCYTKYGLKRTGCAGCPFNRSLFNELENTKEFEPQLIKAVEMIFKDSYEYTMQYKRFMEALNDTT